MNRQSTEDLGGNETILYDTTIVNTWLHGYTEIIMVDMRIHLSRPVKYTTLRVKFNVNYGFRVIMEGSTT